MGNRRFRLSNMIPIALFYKLRNQTKTRNTKPKKKQSSPLPTPSLNPYYYHPNRINNICNSPKNPKATDTHFPDHPPRKSNRKSRKSMYNKPFPLQPITSFSSKQTNPLEFPLARSDSTNDMDSWSSSSATDIIIETFNVFDEMPEHNLPPILTKKESKNKNETESNVTGKPRSCSSEVRIRGNSPRLARKKVKRHAVEREDRVFESFAMVKLSLDPEKDFRESMMEMIEEINLSSSKDLEELLASFLLLNSSEYHGLIVKAFEQIWFNMHATS